VISVREIGSKLASPADSVEIGDTGVHVHRLENFQDDRGGLAIIDFATFKPFTPQRIFYSSNVPKGQSRGHHAHKSCHQFLIALGGSCLVNISDGRHTSQVRLDSELYGISVPPMIWSSQSDFSENAILLVLASEPYREDDYIRDHEEYLSTLKGWS
jgi:UDP-2-acetamido-3-amino-2,3-dideoxy-glucuronate N-acetyltransferase